MTSMPTKIFVGNLTDNCKCKDLQTLFEKFGKVVECDILRNFGFVHMQEEEDAKAAIAALNGYTFNGNHMNVEISHGKGSRRRLGGRGGASGGGRSDFSRRPGSSSRYEPYTSRSNSRYPSSQDRRGYDSYERRPGLSSSYERRLPPVSRDYRRDRDPYGRPPPEYYKRSPDRYDDRLQDIYGRRPLPGRSSSRSSHGASY